MRVLLLRLVTVGIASGCSCDSSAHLGNTQVGEGSVAKLEGIESAEACCAECSSHSACVTWTYEPSKSKCWLKDNDRSSQSNSDRVSGFCSDSPSPVPSPSPTPSPVPSPSSRRRRGYYYTDFSSSDGWEISTDGCGHCSNHGGDECTAYTKDAVQWTSHGAVLTTRKTSSGREQSTSTANLTTPDLQCSPKETSGHITLTTPITYGTYTVKAKYFPEARSSGNAISYIGMMGDDSSSCTFILHGCSDHNTKCRSSHNSACYASLHTHERNKESDILFDGGHGDLREFNEFQMIFHKDDVTWKINGETVRHLKGSSSVHLPHAPMRLRLHTRSQYVSEMQEDSFSATFQSFEFVPQSDYDASVLVDSSSVVV